jgi:hypothetical protein
MKTYKQPFNVYEIRRIVIDNPDAFINKLNDVLLHEGIARAIELIKISGICYCVFGRNKNSSLLQRAVKLLADSCDEDNDGIIRLLYEISCFDQLFKDFSRLMDKAQFNRIPKEDEIPCFLLASESVISAILEYLAGIGWDIINNKYPVAKKPVNNQGEPLVPLKDIILLSYIYEAYVGHIGRILTYFYYQDASFKGSNKVLSKDNLEIASKHLLLFELFASLCILYENWMYLDCKLDKKDGEIYFNPVNDDEYLDSEISLDRFNHLKHQDAAELINVIKDFKFQPTTTELFPKGLRSYTEVFSGLSCEDLLGSYDLKEKVIGVAITEWLRAFSIITENGQAFIKKRSAEASLTVNNWCMLRDKNEWIHEFEKGGIATESANIIIDNLIFSSGAEDVLDYPFIEFEGKLLCLPSAITSLDAAQSLLSNLSAKNIDISFKGKMFEDNSLKIVKNADIPAFKLHEKHEDQEYECDLVFLISEELYFVECKSFIQTRKAKEYYELLVKAYEASKQLSRNAEYFLNQSSLLKEKFNKQTNWSPRKTHKIVLSKANITPIYMNESLIIDSSTFVRFFKRDKVAVIKGDRKIATVADPTCEGPITNEKFLNYIQDPIHIRLIKNNRVKKESGIKICDYTFYFPRYEEKIPFYGIYEEK